MRHRSQKSFDTFSYYLWSALRPRGNFRSYQILLLTFSFSAPVYSSHTNKNYLPPELPVYHLVIHRNMLHCKHMQLPRYLYDTARSHSRYLWRMKIFPLSSPEIKFIFAGNNESLPLLKKKVISKSAFHACPMAIVKN